MLISLLVDSAFQSYVFSLLIWLIFYPLSIITVYRSGILESLTVGLCISLSFTSFYFSILKFTFKSTRTFRFLFGELIPLSFWTDHLHHFWSKGNILAPESALSHSYITTFLLIYCLHGMYFFLFFFSLCLCIS